MTSAVAYLRRLADSLGRICGLDPIERESSQRLVYRARGSGGLNDSWERRIIELGNGRAIAEITELLYKDEIKAGAWAVDVGLWKRLFDRSVTGKINELASKGYIYLSPEMAAKEDADGRNNKEEEEDNPDPLGDREVCKEFSGHPSRARRR